MLLHEDPNDSFGDFWKAEFYGEKAISVKDVIKNVEKKDPELAKYLESVPYESYEEFLKDHQREVLISGEMGISDFSKENDWNKYIANYLGRENYALKHLGNERYQKHLEKRISTMVDKFEDALAKRLGHRMDFSGHIKEDAQKQMPDEQKKETPAAEKGKNQRDVKIHEHEQPEHTDKENLKEKAKTDDKMDDLLKFFSLEKETPEKDKDIQPEMEKDVNHMYKGREFHIVDLDEKGKMLVYGDPNNDRSWKAELYNFYYIGEMIDRLNKTNPEFAEFLNVLPQESYDEFRNRCSHDINVKKGDAEYDLKDKGDWDKLVDEAVKTEEKALETQHPDLYKSEIEDEIDKLAKEVEKEPKEKEAPEKDEKVEEKEEKEAQDKDEDLIPKEDKEKEKDKDKDKDDLEKAVDKKDKKEEDRDLVSLKDLNPPEKSEDEPDRLVNKETTELATDEISRADTIVMQEDVDLTEPGENKTLTEDTHEVTYEPER